MPINIPQTKEALEREFQSVSGKLESLGLSTYESKAYIALIAHGYGNAELIAKTAQIPRTSAYSVLKSLEAKGFAIATSGRPVIYKPEPPSKIFERVKVELEETFQKLELIHEIEMKFRIYILAFCVVVFFLTAIGLTPLLGL